MGTRKRKSVNRICFDLETELFSEQFKNAKSERERIKHAPKMRLGCAYLQTARRYQFFTPGQVNDLIKLLSAADEIVSFNGDNFDFFVLRRHYGLDPRVFRKAKHIDMHKVLSTRAGFRVSLNRAAQLNFNESKIVKGRDMAILQGNALKSACKQDVRLTFKLWRSYSNGELEIPKLRRQRGGFDEGPMPGEQMPEQCPECGFPLVLVEEDESEMTEGQQAVYEAGISGVAYCDNCGELVDW